MLLLDYLERIDVKNDKARRYINMRAFEVRQHIARLRRFASLKPGRVAEIVNVQADTLQYRLDHVLSK